MKEEFTEVLRVPRTVPTQVPSITTKSSWDKGNSNAPFYAVAQVGVKQTENQAKKRRSETLY